MWEFEPEVARPIKFFDKCFYRNRLLVTLRGSTSWADKIWFCCFCCFLLPPSPPPKLKWFWGKQTWCPAKELCHRHHAPREGLREVRVWACASKKEGTQREGGREGGQEGREWHLQLNLSSLKTARLGPEHLWSGDFITTLYLYRGKWFCFPDWVGKGREESKETQRQSGAIPNIKNSSCLDVQSS